jgi:hypothetical protein
MYGSVAGADTYHAERLNAEWTGPDADKAAALLRASEWLYGAYSERYADMPDPYVPGVIPLRLEYAAYEAALRELIVPNSLTPDFVANQQAKREKVGPIETEYWSGQTLDTVRPVLTTVEFLMAPLLTPAMATAIFVV